MVEKIIEFFICIREAVLCIINMLFTYWDPQYLVDSMVIDLYSAPVR